MHRLVLGADCFSVTGDVLLIVKDAVHGFALAHEVKRCVKCYFSGPSVSFPMSSLLAC